MSKATICDICNKVLRSNPASTIEIDAHPDPDVNRYELCRDCTELLKRWIRHNKMENIKNEIG